MNDLRHYSMIIQWSAEDGVYLVSFPEWSAAGHIAHTHGHTYEDAVRQGQAALELLKESAHDRGQPLPTPHTFSGDCAV